VPLQPGTGLAYLAGWAEVRVVGLRATQDADAPMAPIDIEGHAVEEAQGRQHARELSSRGYPDGERASPLVFQEGLIDARAAVRASAPRSLSVRARIDDHSERRAADARAFQADIQRGLRDTPAGTSAGLQGQIAQPDASRDDSRRGPSRRGRARPRSSGRRSAARSPPREAPRRTRRCGTGSSRSRTPRSPGRSCAR
jgi:hypothetical protein